MSGIPRAYVPLPHRLALWAIIAVGLAGSVVMFVHARGIEHARIDAEFSRRTVLHHAMVRETFSRYEDALFGLRTLFVVESDISRTKFVRATERLEERIPGVRAFEWVAAVSRENRAAAEDNLRANYAPHPLGFTEVDSRGALVAAADRAEYYPVTHVQPLAGNERAVGYDLKSGPTLAFLENARRTRQLVLTGPVSHVAGPAASDRLGVLMIWPVFRAALAGLSAEAESESFLGFVQAVVHVPDAFAATQARQPDPVLDVLVIDTGESDPSKNILYHHLAGQPAPAGPIPSIAAFRDKFTREQTLAIGGREWNIFYRPHAHWIEAQLTLVPWVRAGGILIVTALLAGLVYTLNRRTDVIQREVVERTADLRSTQSRLEEDILHRNTVEAALLESRRQLDSLMHALPGMVYRCRYDQQMSVVFVSEGSFALTGATPEDFVQGRVHFRDLIHPGDLDRVRSVTREALDQHRDFETEYRLIHRANGAEKWVLSRGRGIKDAGGELQLIEGLAIDITARKKAEGESVALERKLLEGQKLESLGLLAGGVAHDFNNLLTAILGNAGLARLSLPPSAVSVETALRQIEIASQRAAELCRQMLAYAGKGRFVVEPTDLSLLIEGLRPLLKISVTHRASLLLELASGLPAVMGDATQLRQIAMNLVTNASDALGDLGGEIVVSTGFVRATAATFINAAAGADLPPGDYVYLEIRDTGHGMTPDVLAKIFDPFFTTKFTGRGLGLAAVLGIVRGHSGALCVDSAPDRGTSFRLFLTPVQSTAPAPAGVSSATPWRSSAHVLVIDDDEPVREVTSAMLQSFGFKTSAAADGFAGLEMYRENPAAYDVVVLDLLMPGLDGESTLRELRGLRPDVRVLIISGYHEGDLLKRYSSGGPIGYLHKPFKRGALERALREVLG